MPRTGTSIHNPGTGETITWLETSRDTGGRHVRVNVVTRPGGYLPVRHLHPRQTETFTVTRGTLRVELEGETRRLHPGDTLTIAPGLRHQWWNDSAQEEVSFEMRIAPALKFDVFLEQFEGLSRDGKTTADGSPGFLQIMAMANEYDLFIAGPPVPVQRAMAFVIGGVARLLGYRKFYPQYHRSEEAA